MKWIREIRKVGIADWIWFVIWLQRNEFHRKLELWEYYQDAKSLTAARRRAPRIDMELDDV